MNEGWAGTLRAIRAAEAAAIRAWLPPGAEVLEIGGGSGFQASILAAWGCRVTSIDLPVPDPPPPVQYYPVQGYDGIRIPAADGAFDRIVSSNVLEHIPNLRASLAEQRRVLRPDGLAIHIVPSPAWRFWTTLSDGAGNVAGYLDRRRTEAGDAGGHGDPPLQGAAGPSPTKPMVRTPLLLRVARKLAWMLALTPHGEYPSAVHELWYFSRLRWSRLFGANGFEIVQVETNGLFYTGDLRHPEWSMEKRERLSRWLGAACWVFVLRSQGSRTDG